MIALQAFANIVESNALPGDQVRVLFALLDGRTFVLDTATRPALSEVQPAAASQGNAALEVLCNGAGLVGLLQNQLDGRSGQVFLARGDRKVLGQLAVVLERVRQSPLAVRMGLDGPSRAETVAGSNKSNQNKRG
ncbi:MAG: hypothetical protein JXR83_19950 [Deltaproteobacteria bacterium]|nr:hypothetical protein [Deltaproteobacteria bacterium]